MTPARTPPPHYAEVAPDAPVPEPLTYLAPPAPDLAPGMRVVVPFGGRKVIGTVVRLSAQLPAGVDPQRVKPIAAILDSAVLVPPELLAFVLKAAAYYLHPPGQALATALPAGLAARGQQRLALTPEGRLRLPLLEGTPEGALLAAVAVRPGLTPKAALARVGTGANVLRHALRDGLIATAAAGPKAAGALHRIQVRLTGAAADLEAACAGSKVRRAVADALAATGAPLWLADLTARIPGAAAAVKQLARAGVVTAERAPKEREGALPSFGTTPPVRLSPEQARAVTAITAAVQRRAYEAFVLHGVTGSGKTAVYLETAGAAVAGGQAAVILLPEIGLTPRVAAQFHERFPGQVAVFHSGLSPGERRDSYHRVLRGEARVVVGARSAVFAPVQHPGLIIVDEEHDSSYKQDTGFRYHARDLAMLRAKMAGIPVVLGSATPSLETWRHAESGRATLLAMTGRPAGGIMARVAPIDLRRFRPPEGRQLAAPLVNAVRERLDKGQQVLLYLNRRGFAPVAICPACGQTLQCTQCSVAYTYHRARHEFICHHCGGRRAGLRECPACGAGALTLLGAGSERIEDEAAALFPGARLARLDRDAAHSRERLFRILEAMQKREIDILVGTQMIAKGHDFHGVTLVGVLAADLGLGLPDPRAEERVFQLLTQVAGRAGRGLDPGEVMVQTYQPAHPVIQAAMAQDFQRFADYALAGRRERDEPPFTRLGAVWAEGPSEGAVECAARDAARILARTGQPVGIRGPMPAPLARLKGRFRWQIIVSGASHTPVRAALQALVPPAWRPPRGVEVYLDIDPHSVL